MISYSSYHKCRSVPRMDLTSDVIFLTRTEAEECLLAMLRKIERTGKVTMGYFLALASVRKNEDDMDVYDRLGWNKDDIDDFIIERDRSGYYIRAPKFRLFKKEENNETD